MATTQAPAPRRSFLTIVAATMAGLVAVTWLWVIDNPRSCISPDSGTWIAKMQMAGGHLPAGRVIILGDSCTAADLAPPLLGNKVIDLGLSASSPIESYFMARRLLKTNTPAAVMVYFRPIHFENGSDVFLFESSAKFGLINTADLETIRRLSRNLNDPTLFGSPTPFDSDARLKDYLLPHRFPAYYFGGIVEGRIGGWKQKSLQEQAYTILTRGFCPTERDYKALILDPGPIMETFRPSPVVDDYFRQTLTLFQERHIPVYFASMPNTPASFKALTPEAIAGYTAYLQQMAATYPVFKIVGDVFTSMPNEYFSDATHLSSAGAVVCSQRTRALLSAAGVDLGTADARWKPPVRNASGYWVR